ncbi:MAG: hypothetical protein WC379_10640 [Methanoregula sp.]|jgi:hypothetical protein
MSRPFTLVAILMVIVLVFSAGCVHGKIETDLFAAKIDNNGRLAWVQVIDSGQNDVGLNLTETTDSDYLITGGFYGSFCGSSHASAITPYEIRLSPQGTIDSMVNHTGTSITYDQRSESYNSTGWFSFTADDGSQLSTYQKVKGGALYYRILKTDTGGKELWDTPFLTLKYRMPPKDIWETLYVQGIVPTSDKGYIVWGHRERSNSC